MTELPRRTAEPAPAAPRFRPDIEGLRAVAVGLVLLYHAGIPVVRGGFAGVDVFFVISGFLITGVLIREVEKTGRVNLAQFWARRIRRLLPAATLVLASTALATKLLVSRMDWARIGGDITWSAMNLVNWRLASQSIDYLAEGQLASPAQHFWSLAVEEQFYFVWPVVILLFALVARRLHRVPRPMLLLGLLAITIPSLAWSLWYTAKSPADAYFVTTTRLWELGLGALTAVLAGVWDRLRPEVGRAIAWGGLAAVALTAFVFSTRTPWPGAAALVPTLGTAAVIAGGASAGAAGPVRWLGKAPLVWLGGLSYSLYLWHWPIIAIAALRWNGLSWWQGTLLALVSIIPAWLTNRFLENPIRHGAWGKKNPGIVLSVGLNLAAIGTIAGLALSHLGLQFEAAARTSTVQSLPSGVPTPGASSEVTPYAEIVPNPALADEDLPEAYAKGCQAGVDETTALRCRFGTKGANTKVVLVGDSKVLQWLPALDAIGDDRGWQIITYTKSACAWADADQQSEAGKDYPQCREWSANVAKAIAAEKGLDLVITSTGESTASLDGRDPNAADLLTGLRANAKKVGALKIPLVALSDTQSPGMEVYRCVAGHPDDYATACTFPPKAGNGSAALRAMVDAAAEDGADEGYINMDPWICRTETCQPVVGGILTYRQGSHITATYAKALSPVLEKALLTQAKKLGTNLS
ncbi:acyltransferase family protein [Luteococcus sanguinis]|uniref:Acyltransferase family protein n=1 Tax=Luteococcus sanguinis TaxID=174038 RepID=A0ABW1X4U5_9ACTN